MHSKASLTGPFCKCMDCAAARHKALEVEARRRYSDEFYASEAIILQTEHQITKLETQRDDAKNDQRLVIERVRREIADEQAT